MKVPPTQIGVQEIPVSTPVVVTMQVESAWQVPEQVAFCALPGLQNPLVVHTRPSFGPPVQ